VAANVTVHRVTMDPSPAARCRRVPSTRIADDTYLIHQVQEPNEPGCSFYVNSMVIAGREPVIVDTGTSANGPQWLDDVFSIVDPADVRWIVLSHDDADHIGNLPALITTCPNAVVVSSREVFDRQPDAFALLPASRRRWVDEGDTFDVGDRHLCLVRPPVLDVAVTSAVLDQLTGVYWSADAFACLLPDEAVETVVELEPEFWAHGMTVFANQLLSPSPDVSDELRFAARCDQAQALGMTTIASAHSPVITDTSIDHAFALLRDLPRIGATPHADHRVFDRQFHGGHATEPCPRSGTHARTRSAL
jgi:flavorubredoxin